MRVIFVLALAFALAGCTGDSNEVGSLENPGTEPQDQTTSPTETNEPSEPAEPNEPAEPQPNETAAPTASLLSDVSSGQAPLTVTFTIESDGATSWSLDADGDGAPDAEGESSPTQTEFTYEAVGEYVATLTVTNGEESATSSTEISVLEVEAEPEPVQTVEGGYASGFGAGCSPVGGFFSSLSGVFDHQSFEPVEASFGLPYVVEFTATAPAVEYKVQFWSGGNTIVQQDTSDEGTIMGVVPDGTDQVLVTSCGGADVSFTYVAG